MEPLPAWASAAPVAHLATVAGSGADARPHLVPVVFCVADEAIYVPIDGKPKRSGRLQRVANIEANPAVSLLIDEYDEDWSKLRWLRIDGAAKLVDTTAPIAAALRRKYPQYGETAIGTVAIRIAARDVSSWAASAAPAQRTKPVC